MLTCLKFSRTVIPRPLMTRMTFLANTLDGALEIPEYVTSSTIP